MRAGRNLHCVRKDGAEFPAEFTLNPIQMEDGTMVLATIVDVTDSQRKMAESGYLAAIVESSNDAIVSKNLAGIITTWNPAAEALFGYAANEIVGRHISLLLPRDRRDEEDLILGRIKLGEQVRHFETCRRRKDGREIAVSLTISPIRSPAGEIIGASKIARDITESRRFDQQIIQERDTAQRYLDVAGVMILALDVAGNITLINRRGCNILGYDDAKDIVGKS
jgi:PAS domain S-box-containing protein